ncbi:MAG: tail fiber domain-containing protein [Candidatus Paceibacterota bacterium]
MKRSFFSLIILLPFFSILNSQVKYTSSGNFGIGTPEPLSILSVNNVGNSGYTSYFQDTDYQRVAMFKLYDPANTGTNYNISLMGHVSNLSAGKNVAGYFSTFQSTLHSGRTICLRAVTGNGLDKYNIGVYGELMGSRKGSAIVGSIMGEPTINGYYAGYFDGDVKITDYFSLWVGSTHYTSDIRLKQNVISLESNQGSYDNLNKIKALEAIQYQYLDRETLRESPGETNDTTSIVRKQDDRVHIGLSAQELQKIIPELVEQDSEGYLGIDYIGIIPILIESIKEQQVLIEELQIELGIEIANQKKSITAIEGNVNETNSARLNQNIPNPFNNNTTIKYVVPLTANSSTINLYDLNGKQLRSFDISPIGEGELTIPAFMLEPGIYIYNLIIDGIIVYSKQMIITD